MRSGRAGARGGDRDGGTGGAGRAALKDALRDGSRADPGERQPDRASVVRFFDAVRSRLAAEMQTGTTNDSATDEDDLAEAVRLTKGR